MTIEFGRDGITREQVWLAAWLAVAGASNSTKKEFTTAWADHCLKDFDERFPRPERTSEGQG